MASRSVEPSKNAWREMMNFRESEEATLSFDRKLDRGAVEETLYPWEKTIAQWELQGLPKRFREKLVFPAVPYDNLYVPRDREVAPDEKLYNSLMTDEVQLYEQGLGFDPLKRVAFRIPFQCYDERVIEETREYTIRIDRDGWTRQYFKNGALTNELKPAITSENDWAELKEKVLRCLDRYCTDENMVKSYGRYRQGHENGDFSIRFRASGFFWTPRMLLGIEGQMLSYYDFPGLMRDINEFVLQVYRDQMDRIFDIFKPNVVFFEEDLSGSAGPMISSAMFDEFVGAYHSRLVRFLKQKGIRNVFVDTDGDFTLLIPNFMKAGIDGFLPMDVHGGMDIVAVRKEFPGLKFIGGFNKLHIARGREAMDWEFERIMPVIRQGGYLPGNDHQVPPDAPLDNYKYYIERLGEVMQRVRSR
jgi:hypothetical protein